ncbi:MAG: heparinase II/III family protein [Phenylobacterium sp.]
MAPGSALDRIPGGYQAFAVVAAIRRRAGLEWRASPLNHWRLASPAPEGLAATPKDFRLAQRENGARILAGGFQFNGETLASGPRGDPWDRPAPSRRFAEALHGFGWLKDLTLLDEPGAWEGLRLTLAWRRLFGRWNAFAWTPEVLERRVFNLACHARAVCGPASEAEAEEIAGDLARQARFLIELDEGPARASERAAVAAVAGAALAGPAGEGLLERAMGGLRRALPHTVRPDGAHASRSPQAALELYFDLLTLEDALAQLCAPVPDEMVRALEGLAGAVRAFTLADGRLASFQGGDSLSAPYVAAARAADRAAVAPAVIGGYSRLETRSLQVMVDGATPAAGAWSVAACAQPLALELLAGGRRIIVNSGWSPAMHAPQALRLVDAASTLALAEDACGEPLSGFAADWLGPRLRDLPQAREVRRHEAEGAVWLQLEHDGWLRGHGLRHERRLYLDREADELRGEDRLTPAARRTDEEGRRFAPFVVRFHLAPQVSALIARDRKSVLLKAEGEETGWWLRNDALEVSLEPSVTYQDGLARHGEQIVLRGQARLDAGARVRWKLSAAHSLSEPARVDAAEVAA